MEIPKSTNLSSSVFAFSDCGLVVNPNAEELSEIAIQTAKSFDFLTKEERYFAGHQLADAYYNFGFKWTTGSK